MKKVISFLVAFMLMISLPGCANQNDKQMEATTTAATTATEKTDELVRISILTHNGNANIVPNNDMILYKELQKITGVEIVWDTVPVANLKEVIAPRLAAGANLPDIINMIGITTVQGLQFFNDGLIIDLTDLVDKNGPGLKKLFSENEVARANGTYEGKILNYPESIRFKNAYSAGMLINKPWLDKLGLEAPESVDELYAVLKAFKADKPDSVPLAGVSEMEMYLRNPFGDQWQHSAQPYSYIVDGNGKVDAFVRTAGYKEYLTYLNRLYSEGLFLKIDNEQVTKLATEDQLGAFCHYVGYGCLITNEVIDPSKQSVPFIPMKPLTGPGKSTPYNYSTIPVGSGGFGFVVTKDCKRPDAAVKLLDMIQWNEEVLTLMHWGIEGTHYEVVDGRKVMIDENLRLKDGGIETTLPTRQFPERNDAIRPIFAEYDKMNMRPYHISGYEYPNLNFEEIEAYGAFSDVSTYLSEQTVKFIKGERKLDEFDDFVTQINELGLEEMVKIQQAAYDRFKSK